MELKVGMKVLFDYGGKKDCVGVVEWFGNHRIATNDITGSDWCYSETEGFNRTIKATGATNIRRHPDFQPVVGDIMLDEDGDERKVLAVVGECFAVSFYNEFDKADLWLTFKESIAYGYKIKGLEPKQKLKVTPAEIASKFGVDELDIEIVK